MGNETDDELIKQAKSGDESAAELLIRRYYPAILRYCMQHCPNRATAEDLTQEAFIRLFRSLEEYQGRGKFKAYLYKIANNLCIDESRKSLFLSTDELPPESHAALVCEENGFCRVEDREEVARLLNLLTPEQREAVLLRFSGQLSFSEIAAVTGCKLRTAQSRIRNALHIMRKESTYVP